MALQVLKFGASALGDAEGLETIARIVAARSVATQTVIVLSAVRGITDLLLGCAAGAETGDDRDLSSAIERLRAVHLAVAREAQLDVESYRVTLDRRLDRVAELARAIRTLGCAPQNAVDEIAGTGERLAIPLLAGALERLGVPARIVDGADVIALDPNGAPERSTLGARARQIVAPILDDGAVAIVAGYVARDADGGAATLGRGGSDLTAALVALALDADSLTFYKDVDGVLSADPTIVVDARLQTRLSFEETRELARLGTKLLHPSALAPLEGARTRVEFRNVAKPESPGTIVHADAETVYPRAKAVIAAGERALLSVASGDSCSTIVVDRARAHDVKRALEGSLRTATSDTGTELVQLEIDVVHAAIVGHGVADEASLVARVFAKLAERAVLVRAISRSASGCALRLVISGCTAADAAALLHEIAVRDAGAAVRCSSGQGW